MGRQFAIQLPYWPTQTDAKTNPQKIPQKYFVNAACNNKSINAYINAGSGVKSLHFVLLYYCSVKLLTSALMTIGQCLKDTVAGLHTV